MSHSHLSREAIPHWIDKRRHKQAMTKIFLFLGPLTIGLLALLLSSWPSATHATDSPFALSSDTRYVSAHLITVDTYQCVNLESPGAIPISGGNLCAKVVAEFEELGEIKTANFEAEPSLVNQGIEVGSKVILASFDANGTTIYMFQDFDRGNSVVIAIGVLVLIVLIIGKWQGLRALFGLIASAAAILLYAIPHLTMGTDVIYLVGLLVPLMTILLLYSTHGFSIKTSSAVLGTLGATFVTILGSVLVVKGLNLTGFHGEEDILLSETFPNIRLSDLLTIGIIISTFGALNDVTVTQASAVWELAESKDLNRIFSGAMKIGRDHIASCIYTVAFAFAGSSLVTLIFLVNSNIPSGALLTNELLAEEIAFLVVGLSGVILSMPLTTWVAIKFASLVKTASD